MGNAIIYVTVRRCGGVEKELHEPLHFRNIPENFVFWEEKGVL